MLRAADVGEEVGEHLKQAEAKDAEAAADYGGDDDDKALVERLRHELHPDMAAIKVEPVQTGDWE